MEDVKPSTATQEKVAPLTDANTAVVLRGVDDSFDYPKAWALGFITLALALAVFLTALVSILLSPLNLLKLQHELEESTTRD